MLRNPSASIEDCLLLCMFRGMLFLLGFKFAVLTGSFGRRTVTPYCVGIRSPFLWHFDSGVEVLVWFFGDLGSGCFVTC